MNCNILYLMNKTTVNSRHMVRVNKETQIITSVQYAEAVKRKDYLIN